MEICCSRFIAKVIDWQLLPVFKKKRVIAKEEALEFWKAHF
jgi:hypothetical protein